MNSRFNERLTSLRNESGLNQKECAEKLGVSISRYNKWETGANRPDFETVCKIANHYGVTTDYLIGHTDVKNPAYQGLVSYTGVSEKIFEVLLSEELNTRAEIDDYAADNLGKIDTRSLKYIAEQIISSPEFVDLLYVIRERTLPHEHYYGTQWEDEPIEWGFMENGNIYGQEKKLKDAGYTQLAQEMLNGIIQHVGEQSVKRWIASRPEILAKAEEARLHKKAAEQETEGES